MVAFGCAIVASAEDAGVAHEADPLRSEAPPAAPPSCATQPGACAAACARLERDALPLAELAAGLSRARVVRDEEVVAACLRSRGLAWDGALAAKRRPWLGAAGTVQRLGRRN